MKKKIRADKFKSHYVSKKLYPSLSTLEISLYTLICIVSATYSLYSINKISMEKLESGSLKYGIEKIDLWWQFWTSRQLSRDHSDYEWVMWKKISSKGSVVNLS